MLRTVRVSLSLLVATGLAGCLGDGAAPAYRAACPPPGSSRGGACRRLGPAPPPPFL
ncbi:MAG: hypothetical protein AB1445_09790 [Bacillota bacterium]